MLKESHELAIQPERSTFVRLAALQLIASFAATSALADPVQLKLEQVDKAGAACLNAIDDGKIIKTENGLTYIRYEYDIFIIRMDQTSITCEAMMVTAE